MKLRNCIVKIAACTLIFLAAIELLWLVGGTVFLNTYLTQETINSFLPSNVKLTTNHKIKTYPDFSVKISCSNANISHKDKDVVTVKNLKTKIQLLPILTRTIKITQASADDLTINIIKNKDGCLNVEKIIPDIIKNLHIKNIETRKVSIPQYTINFTNETLKYNSSLKGKNLILPIFATSKQINLSTTGEIFTRGKNANFSIDLNTKFPLEKHISDRNFHIDMILNEIDLSEFAPLTKYFPSSKIKDVNGIVTASISTIDTTQGEKAVSGLLTTQNLYIKENLAENDTFLTEKTNINFELTSEANNIIIKEFNLKNTNHNLDIKGMIGKINTKKPQLDITAKLHNDKKSMIYNAIPSELEFENRMIAKIKKYKPKATIDGEIHIIGNAVTPDIIGEFHAPDLFIDQPIANEAKATIKLEFLKDKLHVSSYVIPNKGTFVDVDGMINMYGDKSAIFNIKSGKNVKLPLTRAVLMPIQDTFSLNFGILNQIYAQKGFGDATLYIDGTRTDAIVNGRLNFYDGQATLEGLNAQVNNVSGYLNFKEKDADFATYTSDIDGRKVKISGTGNFDGSFTLDLSSENIKTQTLFEILTTSKMLEPIATNINDLSLVQQIKGDSNILLKLKGKMKDPKGPINIDDLTYLGELKLKNNIVKLKDIKTPIQVENTSSKFDKKTINIDANLKLITSPITVKATIANKNTSFNASSNKFMLKDIITIAANEGIIPQKVVSNYPTSGTSYLTFNSDYSGKDKFDINKLKLDASIKKSNTTNAPTLSATQGTINIKNGNAEIKKVTLNLLDSMLTMDGVIKNIAAKEPGYNLFVELKNLNAANLNKLPTNKSNSDIVKIVSAYENYSGLLNGSIRLKKGDINGKLHASNIAFTHKKMQLPFSIDNAEILFKNNIMFVNRLNAKIDDIPLFINLSIKNILEKPIIKAYITSNIYPSFINKYVNANLGYPIKLKGELSTKTFFIGSADNFKATTVLSVPTGSDISYMGANLGEDDTERELRLEVKKSGNILNIINASYSKYITSLNFSHTKYPFIVANGKIRLDATPYLDNFKVKTVARTSSKFFNIIFRKSILKFGDFECDFKLNGPYTTPKILGFIKLRNLDMPLYETVVKDIFADFSPNDIAIKIFGNVYDTNINVRANMVNNFIAPYKFKNIDIEADYLDLDKIYSSISKVTMQPTHSPKYSASSNTNNIQQTIIDEGNISAKKILIKGFPATDLKGKFHEKNDNKLKITDFNFNIANGKIEANGEYDLKSGIIKADCIAKNIDANQFSQIFLNMKNQIYGNLNGKVKLTTSGNEPAEQLENLFGNVSFIIVDGKMPKLGSLEYLLRAGNIIKSGITGFTVNNIIELLVPIRTGEFSSINGEIELTAGKANNIQIYSKGKNLSLYITGNANLLNGYSQMEVFGRLSKNISTLLGPIGNTSLNTLFNLIPGIKETDTESSLRKDISKIPGLEFSTDTYRFFRATIDGDVNGSNYVKTFKWVE